MIYEAYSVYDKAVGAFSKPFYQHRRGEAIRTFTDAVSDPKSPFGTHASDYTLFFVGVFDDSSGLFKSPDVPERVISAQECMPSSG